ncbi:MAG: hypothetical protein KDK64_07115 [Chlamydiia bacterium]|nr:hypothetical protein [Chlamydiia bacterium]
MTARRKLSRWDFGSIGFSLGFMFAIVLNILTTIFNISSQLIFVILNVLISLNIAFFIFSKKRRGEKIL